MAGGIRRDAADSWFSKCVRHRDNFRCTCCQRQYTPSDTGLHCAHIWGRANKSTRWDMGNAIALCYACHQRFTANPIEFSAWVSTYLGTGHMELLRERKNQILRTTKQLRKEIAKHYKSEYEKAQNDNNYEIVGY